MQTLLAVAVAATNLLFSQPIIYTAPPSEVVIIERTLEDKVGFYANKYNVSSEVMLKVIDCESRGVETAVGDGGDSHGLVQIHLPSWPEITQEQAINPGFALDFMAKRFSEGRYSLWSCYRKLYN